MRQRLPPPELSDGEHPGPPAALQPGPCRAPPPAQPPPPPWRGGAGAATHLGAGEFGGGEVVAEHPLEQRPPQRGGLRHGGPEAGGDVPQRPLAILAAVFAWAPNKLQAVRAGRRCRL